MVLRGASGAADTPEIPGKGAASQTYAPAGHFRVTGCGECSMWWPALISGLRGLLRRNPLLTTHRLEPWSASKRISLRIHHALILSILLFLINIFRCRDERPATGFRPVSEAAAARAFVRHAVTVPMMATAMMISHKGMTHTHAPLGASCSRYGQVSPCEQFWLQQSSRFMRLPWPWP
jgi:hypothetical protein